MAPGRRPPDAAPPSRPSRRRRAIRAARALAVPLGLTLLAGCWDETSAQAPAAAPEIRDTSAQVNRAGKRDALRARALAAEVAEAALAPEASHDETAALHGFHAALAALESGARREPVTILHLGDSHIASDRFTGDLRALFQARFGDAGRGLLMPGYPFPHYRANGVRFAKAGQWETASSLLGDPGPYGLTGTRLTTAEADAFLRLTGETGPFEWAEVTFAAGPARGTALVAVDDRVLEVATEAETEAPSVARLRYKGTRLTVRAVGDGPVSVHSWAVGSDRPGVRYVNLGIPSAKAAIVSRWDDAVLAAELDRTRPDLIVLGYGTNEGFDDNLDAVAHELAILALVQRLRRFAPRASLLVIGPADGARFPRFARQEADGIDPKRADCRPLADWEAEGYARLTAERDMRLARWHPPPGLDRARRALARAARRAGAYFWDWSAAMGGPCSVHDWALAEPPLATGDRVHITAAGSRLSARALFDELMEGYAAHRRVASR